MQQDLQKKFLELKAKLEKEGLFAVERKRPLPFLPKAVGVVTSGTGAVIHDIMVKIRERMPQMQVYLVDVRVQGDGAAEEIARDAKRYAAMPVNSVQNSVLTLAQHDLVGMMARLRPFMGQLGTTPSIPFPDSHNAGDFGQFLIGAPHDLAITEEQLAHRTDGHMDIDAVRAGAILICPVKVPGGGIYMGDMHALQGDGEIAGHTCDVSGTVTLQVHVLKGLGIDGPVLFPVAEDLPFLAKPFTARERVKALALAQRYGLDAIEETAPISVVGTGADLNAATENGLERAAALAVRRGEQPAELGEAVLDHGQPLQAL